MDYYDDIEILNAEIIPRCGAFFDRRFPGTYSVEYIGGGRMFFSSNGKKGITIDFSAVFWHHPSIRYRYGAVDKEGWDHHYILIRGKRAKSLIENGFMQVSRKGFVRVYDQAKVEMLFHEMVSLFDTRKISAKGEIVVKLETLLNQLFQEKKKTQSEEDPEIAAFRDLAENISLFPQKSWNFVEEARKLHLSYSHFRRKFREINGIPIYEQLLSAKIKMASRELCKGKKSVKEISDEFGFNDYPHFCCIFRKKIGISPGNFGKMFRQSKEA